MVFRPPTAGAFLSTLFENRQRTRSQTAPTWLISVVFHGFPQVCSGVNRVLTLSSVPKNMRSESVCAGFFSFPDGFSGWPGRFAPGAPTPVGLA